MAKEKGPVADFVQTRKRINDYFGCEGDFFIHPLLDFEWAVREDEDFTPGPMPTTKIVLKILPSSPPQPVQLLHRPLPFFSLSVCRRRELRCAHRHCQFL